MTEKEIYEKFMELMGMKVSKEKTIDNKIVVEYSDTGTSDPRFTKYGYDEFYAGAIFDKEGKIVKAYLDSHVGGCSNNCLLIEKILKGS